MRKIFFVLCIIGFVLGLGTGSLYAADWKCNSSGCASKCTSNNCGTLSVGTDIEDFKTSKNVEILVNSSEQSYAAISDHLNGDRAFGASSDSTKIYYYTGNNKTKGSHYSGNFTASDSSAFEGVTGWSAL